MVNGFNINSKTEKLTEKQEKERASWQYRAVAATRGNQTRLGCILIAVLQRSADHGYPRFGQHAIITSDGFVMASFQDRSGQMHMGALVCDVDELIQNFRGLADYLDFTREDREAMFGEIRKWIEKDYRTSPPLLH